jgi:hypothetical protein
VCYSRGFGAIRNEEAAAYWFQKAAEQGNPAAQFNLGLLHAEGSGVSRDPAAAAEWYRKAALQGYAPAQINLGVAYERGIGVPLDLRQAATWYRRASAGESEAANRNLARIEAALKETAAEEAAPAVVAQEEVAVGEEDDDGTVEIEAGIIESDLPVTAEDIDVPPVAAAAAPHLESGANVGMIVTQVDSVVGEVDSVVRRLHDMPAEKVESDERAIVSVDDSAENVAEEAEAMEALVDEASAQPDDLTIAWRNRDLLPSGDNAAENEPESFEAPVQ